MEYQEERSIQENKTLMDNIKENRTDGQGGGNGIKHKWIMARKREEKRE